MFEHRWNSKQVNEVNMVTMCITMDSRLHTTAQEWDSEGYDR